jgi:hypothetical protein
MSVYGFIKTSVVGFWLSMIAVMRPEPTIQTCPNAEKSNVAGVVLSNCADQIQGSRSGQQGKSKAWDTHR